MNVHVCGDYCLFNVWNFPHTCVHLAQLADADAFTHRWWCRHARTHIDHRNNAIVAIYVGEIASDTHTHTHRAHTAYITSGCCFPYGLVRCFFSTVSTLHWHNQRYYLWRTECGLYIWCFTQVYQMWVMCVCMHAPFFLQWLACRFCVPSV